jgi:nucleobase:cation symporter-1, NCS1 family
VTARRLQQRANLSGIEVRSIDHVPAAERHGRVRDQFTLWFAINTNIFNIVLGGVAVALGVSFGWACIAIVCGTLVGLLLVCFHAIQGPRLGVPQMIQSRGQFGFYGAVLVFIASIVLDFGFLAAQLVIQAEAMHLLLGAISIPVWILILAVPVLVLTIYGYEWIHRWQRWLTAILGITFAVVFIQALTYGDLPASVSGFHVPSFALFMGATSLFVIDMVSYAPYVSDYSRYLPEDVSRPRTFAAVFFGMAVPTVFCAVLGAYITGLLPHAASTIGAVQHVAGGWALLVMALSLVGADSINAYTGMLALASVVSCFRDVRHSVSMRVWGSLAVVAVGTGCALFGYPQFVTNLSNFLNVLLFVFIPWTAINLTDYYLVKRGDYDISAFFTPQGIYGGYLWQGLVPYLLAVVVQIPFIEQTFYTGPLVSALGGTDISWVVGGVAGIVFYLIALRIATAARPALAGGDASASTEPDAPRRYS